jgi:hypothetical protein
MHRFVLRVVVLLGVVLCIGLPANGASVETQWQSAAAAVAVNPVGARPVIVHPSELVQTIAPLTGQPVALPMINPPELDKEAIPERQLPQVFIPQHSAVEDGSARVDGLSRTSQPLAPVRQKTFTGLQQTRFFPPDPTIAAGPTHIIVAVNTSMAFYTRAGVKKFETTFGSWFAKLSEGQNTSLFDPRVIYDQYAQHFIVVVAGIRTSDSRSWFFLAVSKTSNPEGEWAQWALDMQLNGKTKTSNWADFPGVGLDQKGIYLTANMFSFTTDNFANAKIRVLDKTKVYQFGTITWADFFNLHDATGQLAFTIQPVHSYGTVDREYLVSSNDDHGTKLTLWSIQNPSAAKPALLKKGVTVSTYKFPPDAPQKGGGADVNTSDARFDTHGIFAGGFIYASHPVGFDWGSGEVSAIRIYQLSAAGAVVQEITYGADKLYYFYPALEVDSRGNIVVLFNRCGSNEFVGIHYTGRKLNDAAGKLQNSTLLKMSAANYQSQDDSGRNRWGDYNTVALDPVDDSVWLYSEFATQATRWSTQVGKVKFP